MKFDTNSIQFIDIGGIERTINNHRIYGVHVHILANNIDNDPSMISIEAHGKTYTTTENFDEAIEYAKRLFSILKENK